VISIVVLIIVAKSQVNRVKAIDLASNTPGEIFFTSLGMSQHPELISDWAVEARNRVYEISSNFLEDLFPENARMIFLTGLIQLFAAAGIGLWIGSGIDEVAHIIPIAIVAALADVWSVSSGATAVIIKSAEINYFLVRFPLLCGGTTVLPYFIGLADFLFFGIFYQAAIRFNLGITKNILLLGLSFIGAVGAAIMLKVGLPVLPFMGVLFVAGNIRKLQLKRDDLKQVILFLGGVIISALFFMRLVRHFS